jgi:NarL family two-component system response regulator YdfI
MVVQPDVMGRILAQAARAAAPAPAAPDRRPLDLTEREREILDGVAHGDRNKEIAARLGISERTVGSHLNSIFAKLGVDSRASAVAIAIERGLLPHPRGRTQHDE